MLSRGVTRPIKGLRNVLCFWQLHAQIAPQRVPAILPKMGLMMRTVEQSCDRAHKSKLTCATDTGDVERCVGM